jgi:hypothetical protein
LLFFCPTNKRLAKYPLAFFQAIETVRQKKTLSYHPLKIRKLTLEKTHAPLYQQGGINVLIKKSL